MIEKIQEIEIKNKLLRSEFLYIIQEKNLKIDSLSNEQKLLLMEIESLQARLERSEDLTELTVITSEKLAQDYYIGRSKQKRSLILFFSILLFLLLSSTSYIFYLFRREKRINELLFSSLRKYTYNQVEEVKESLGLQIKKRLKKLGRRNKKQLVEFQQSFGKQSASKKKNRKSRKKN
jgi:hypothetical protein